jgi:hypothetical protein
MKSKQWLLISGPSARIKESLTDSGFVRDFVHQSTYRLEMESSEGYYVFQLPYLEADGVATLDGESAFFDGISDAEVPEAIQVAAMDRWYALRTRIDNADPSPYSPDLGDRWPSTPIPSRSIDEAKNGSMVQDFADMKRLGLDMNRMKNGQQLREEGLVDDPIQH